MSQAYVDDARVQASWERIASMPAVMNEQGAVVAYIDLVQCGEVAVISRILGHMDHVDNGVVYLVFDGVMRGLIEQKRSPAFPSGSCMILCWAQRKA